MLVLLTALSCAGEGNSVPVPPRDRCAPFLQQDGRASLHQASTVVSVEEIEAADNRWRAQHELSPRTGWVTPQELARLQLELMQLKGTPEDVRAGQIVLEGVRRLRRWRRVNDTSVAVRIYATKSQFRARILSEVIRNGIKGPAAELLADELASPTNVIDNEFYLPPLSHLPNVRVARLNASPIPDQLVLLLNWKFHSLDMSDNMMLRKLIGDALDMIRLAQQVRPQKGFNPRIKRLEAWKNEMLARDFDDPNVLEKGVVDLVNRWMDEISHYPSVTFVFPGFSFAGVVVEPYLARARVERDREEKERREQHRLVEERKRDARRAEQEAVAREQQAKAAERAAAQSLEREQTARERWTTDGVALLKNYDKHLEDLGLLCGVKLRQDLDTARTLFEVPQGAMTASQLSTIDALLETLAPLSSHCGAEGQAAKPMDHLGAHFKQLVGRHLENGALRAHKEKWTVTEAAAKDANKKVADERRAALDAEHSKILNAQLDPKKAYLAWQDAHTRRLNLHPDWGYFVRVDELLQERLISEELAAHWRKGAVHQGTDPFGGWHAEVMVAERLIRKYGLRVRGFEAEEAAAGRSRSVPDLVVPVHGDEPFVEVKSTYVGDVSHGTKVGGLLDAVQRAEQEFENGMARVSAAVMPDRVLWIALRVGGEIDAEYAKQIELEIGRVLPDPSKGGRANVVIIEAVPPHGPRYQHQAFLLQDGAWVTYKPGVTPQRFLDVLWDPTEREHHH